MEGDLQRAVGHNLRAHREAKGLSQEAFADELGVHRTYMGGIEPLWRDTLRTTGFIARYHPRPSGAHMPVEAG